MNATYTEIYDKLVQTLNYDEQKKKGCGEIKFELITLQNFLTHDATKKMVILKSDKETFKGTFLDSHLQIKLLHYTWLLPVNATFVECKLTSLGFKSSYGSIAYRLGSGKMKYKLPEIKQEPDCGYTFTTFVVKEIKTSDPIKVESALIFDPKTQELIVDSADWSLMGVNADVIVEITQDRY